MVERIQSVCAARMVLVRAPAGFGKTTLMSQCMARMEEQGLVTSWLTLDDADNDVSRFLWCLNVAVSRLTEDGKDLPSPDDRTLTFTGDAAVEIVGRLCEYQSAFALYLEDFGWVRDTAVLPLDPDDHRAPQSIHPPPCHGHPATDVVHDGLPGGSHRDR